MHTLWRFGVKDAFKKSSLIGLHVIAGLTIELGFSIAPRILPPPIGSLKQQRSKINSTESFPSGYSCIYHVPTRTCTVIASFCRLLFYCNSEKNIICFFVKLREKMQRLSLEIMILTPHNKDIYGHLFIYLLLMLIVS